MSNTEREPIELASGPAYTTEERTVEWLDRETDPFGQGRTQFASLALLRHLRSNLREVRISMVGGNVPEGEEQPIDERVRLLVDPDDYDRLLRPDSPTGAVAFLFVADDFPLPFVIHIEREASPSSLDGTTFHIVGARGTGDRPGVLAFWAGMARYLDVMRADTGDAGLGDPGT